MGTTFVPAGTAQKGQQVMDADEGLEGRVERRRRDARRVLALGLPLKAELAADGGLDETELTERAFML